MSTLIQKQFRNVSGPAKSNYKNAEQRKVFVFLVNLVYMSQYIISKGASKDQTNPSWNKNF